MKVFASCAICFPNQFERIQATGKLPSEFFISGEMDDTGLIFVTCLEGHRTAATYNHRKHEILFESGAAALMDDYLVESVSSFATSFERFLEFYLRTVVRSHGISEEAFERVWKLLAAQSQRQLGAFLLLHLVEGGKPFAFQIKQENFRNRVIHRGYFPRRTEVLQYAEYVFCSIRSEASRLRAKYAEAVQEEDRAAVHRQIAAVPPGMPTVSVGRVKMDEGPTDQGFETWLIDFKRRIMFEQSGQAT